MKQFDSREFLSALEELAAEKDIAKDDIISALANAVQKAYNRDIDPEIKLFVDINIDQGVINVYQVFKVVEKVDDEYIEISLEDARKQDATLGLNDEFRKIIKLDEETLSLLFFTQIKQVLKQLINESSKTSIYTKYKDWKGKIIHASVDNIEDDKVLVELEKTKGYLPPHFQIPGEKLEHNREYVFFVEDVLEKSKGWQVILSRTSPNIVKALFEKEVPEISEGTIEIKSVARVAGERSKISVYSHNQNIDPIGACIGQKGIRTKAVSSQINNEKIDIVEWSENPVKLICNVLSPAKAVGVTIISEEGKMAQVIVPDQHLSLAIGKKGSSAKLATWLTGWKIEIKSLTQAFEQAIPFETNGNISVTEAKSIVKNDERNRRSKPNRDNLGFKMRKENERVQKEETQDIHDELEKIKKEEKLDETRSDTTAVKNIPEKKLTKEEELLRSLENTNVQYDDDNMEHIDSDDDHRIDDER